MNNNNEESIFTSKSKKIPTSIKEYEIDSNNRNKLSKLEPNPVPFDESFFISTKMKPNYGKNELINVNKNELTFYKNENDEVNFKISTLKKSEVTFSEEVIDINTHIKKFSNGKFFDISPARMDLKMLKSVNEYRKTPHSKLRYEDYDLDSKVESNKNNENEGEIKICDEILLSQNGKICKNIFRNISIEVLVEHNKDNIEKNNKEKNNCFLEDEKDFGICNIFKIENKFKFNLNKKIENLDKNLNTLNNMKTEQTKSKISDNENFSSNYCLNDHEEINPFSKKEIIGSNDEILNNDSKDSVVSDIENESKIQENNHKIKFSTEKNNIDCTRIIKSENNLFNIFQEKLPQSLNKVKENSKTNISIENKFPTEIQFHSINKNVAVNNNEIEENKLMLTENQINLKTIEKMDNHKKFKPKSILKNSGL